MISRPKEQITTPVYDEGKRTTVKLALPNAQKIVARNSVYCAHVGKRYGFTGNGHRMENHV